MGAKELIETLGPRLQRISQNRTVLVAVAATFGGSVGYKFAESRLRSVYKEIAVQEVEDWKTYYEKHIAIVKKDRTPEEVLNSLHGDETHEFSNITNVYLPTEIPPVPDEVLNGLRGDKKGSTRRNVFDEPVLTLEELGDWNWDEENAKRDSNPDRPFIMHEEEFIANESGYEQEEMTYFEGDDVLVDSQEIPVADSDAVVGDENLTKFGHGSIHKDELHVRNDHLEIEVHITRSSGKYVVEVLGLDDEDELTHSHRPKKFRKYDD